MPSSITNISQDNGGIPIVAENSSKLSSLYLSMPWGDLTLKQEFFDSLKNAPNLTNLSLKRLRNLKFTNLEEYIKYELPSVTTLDLSGYVNSIDRQSIFDSLNGIGKFTNLKTIKMDYTSKTLDISAIKDCPSLTSVTLTYGNINSLNGMEALTNLSTLNLNNNSVSSLKPLENLKKLTSLNLENNAIADTSSYVENGETKTYRNLDILAGLHTSRGGKLTTLKLAGNDNIIDYSPVSSLNWSNKSGF